LAGILAHFAFCGLFKAPLSLPEGEKSAPFWKEKKASVAKNVVQIDVPSLPWGRLEGLLRLTDAGYSSGVAPDSLFQTLPV